MYQFTISFVIAHFNKIGSMIRMFTTATVSHALYVILVPDPVRDDPVSRVHAGFLMLPPSGFRVKPEMTQREGTKAQRKRGTKEERHKGTKYWNPGLDQE